MIARWKALPFAEKNSIVGVMVDRAEHHQRVMENCDQFPNSPPAQTQRASAEQKKKAYNIAAALLARLA